MNSKDKGKQAGTLMETKRVRKSTFVVALGKRSTGRITKDKADFYMCASPLYRLVRFGEQAGGGKKGLSRRSTASVTQYGRSKSI